MVAERTRAINAVTALRTVDLGVDVRKALLHSQFKASLGMVRARQTPGATAGGGHAFGRGSRQCWLRMDDDLREWFENM